ncbi:CRISPR-associated protein [Heliobacterium undosum]|uniref:CRISPR-associated protein n=1 Tax=Heliomicrobium undosum TaxID=121734 RepID=A0A845L7K9_9FIRM|nr:RAMP superfamily CRISPR-associated protein [Heliomicrobium undosum]MZP30620.1 CRISPR-associated protein [Heliomicrobium undosum]
MFKELRNEARCTFQLKTASPLLIKGPSEPGLDPLLPDMRFVRTRNGSKSQPFIPGSSLKGVFRNRAEQVISAILRGLDMKVLPLGDNAWKDKMKNRDGRQRYYLSDPVIQLFGQQYLAGRAAFRDAFPVDGEPLMMGERSHVMINRITGGAQGKGLFNPEVVEEGTFAAEVVITNFACWQLMLFGYLLKDLDEGYMLLGTATTRGYGRVQVANAEVSIRDYRHYKSADEVRNRIVGYEDGDQKDEVACEGLLYTKKGYRWETTLSGYDWLMKLPLDLRESMENLQRKQKEVVRGG